MIEDSVALLSEIDTVALLDDIRSVRMTGDVGNQRSNGSGGAHEEEEGYEDVEVWPWLSGLILATVADAVCIAAPDEVQNDVMVKVEKMTEKLKTESLSLYSEPVDERAAMLVCQ